MIVGPHGCEDGIEVTEADVPFPVGIDPQTGLIVFGYARDIRYDEPIPPG